MVRVGRLELPASSSQSAMQNFFCLFIVVFSSIRSVLLTLWYSLKRRFPGVPAPDVVINVVKKRFPPETDSRPSAPDRKRFSL